MALLDTNGLRTLWAQVVNKIDTENLVLQDNIDALSSKIDNKVYDWNANEGEEGHILNRTHWIETDVVVVSETVIEINNEGNTQLLITEPLAHKLIVGETYKVTLNGVAYESVAKSIELEGITANIIGNTDILFGDNTGEPFIYLEMPESEIDPEYPIYAVIMLLEPLETNTVSITIPELYHKIDQKYLYTPDWNAKENEGGHILNRPFYEEKDLVDILPATAMEFFFEEADGGIGTGILPYGALNRLPEIGDTCVVNIDGTDYQFTVYELMFQGVIPIPAIGNLGELGGENNGEIFGCLFATEELKKMMSENGDDELDGLIAIHDASITTATVSIKLSATTVHRIPDKFLPAYDMEAPEGKEGHILNRTHYRMPFEPIVCELVTEGVDTITVMNPETGEEQIVGYKFSDKVLSLDELNMADTYRIRDNGEKEKIEEYEWELIQSFADKIFMYQCINAGNILMVTTAGAIVSNETGVMFKAPSAGMYFYIESYIKFELSAEGNEIIQKLDAKYLPDGVVISNDASTYGDLASKEYVDNSNVDNISLSTDFISGEITFPGTLTSGPWYCNDKLFACFDNVLHYSLDGSSWTEISSINDIKAIVYGNNTFVAIRSISSNTALYSQDGINWQESTLPTTITWYNIVYGNGKFIVSAFNVSSDLYLMAYSVDGITWTDHSEFASSHWFAHLSFAKDKFFMGSLYGNTYYSEDGLTWSILKGATWTSMTLCSVTYQNDIFVAYNRFGGFNFYYSFNGIDWHDSGFARKTHGLNNSFDRIICHGNGIFMYVELLNGFYVIHYSKDGINWCAINLPIEKQNDCNYIYYNNKFIIAIHNTDKAIYSEDDANWLYFEQNDLDITNNIRGFLATEGLATTTYVDYKVAEIPSIDGLATKKELEDTSAALNTRIDNLSIPTTLAELTDDTTHRVVTDTEKETWNAKSNFSGNYEDLTNKPTIPSIEGLATTKYVDDSVEAKWTELVDSAPETLNTLNELAAALGDDPNFATTVATEIGKKADISKIITNEYIRCEASSLDGLAYTATIPNLTELKMGMMLIMIPLVTSTNPFSTTLNINELGAKSIYRRTTNNTLAYGMLTAYTPIVLLYYGSYWAVISTPKPSASDLDGSVPINLGGHGGATAAEARANLGITPANIGAATPTYVDDSIEAATADLATKDYVDNETKVYWVEFNVNESGIISSNKTFTEITEAYNAGKTIFAKLESYSNTEAILTAIAFSSEMIGFSMLLGDESTLVALASDNTVITLNFQILSQDNIASITDDDLSGKVLAAADGKALSDTIAAVEAKIDNIEIPNIEPFIITLSRDEQNNFTSSHNFDEISAAFLQGKNVFLYFERYMIPFASGLQAEDYQEITFSSMIEEMQISFKIHNLNGWSIEVKSFTEIDDNRITDSNTWSAAKIKAYIDETILGGVW